ncbi:MAG TPA: DNA-3-methyladenine glycosylase I [Pseudomonadales bacterium]
MAGQNGRAAPERCAWCGEDPLYVAYHDEEWGVPVADPRALFERLMLEGMQAGLSWYTVLKKRPHMRRRFFDFDPERLARSGPRRIEAWLKDPGLIRHRGKLEGLIANARAYLDQGDSFAELIWSFVDGAPKQNRWESMRRVPAETPESQAMSRTLKKAGFRFVGPTTCYAFMQSAGLVNDHLLTCHRHAECRRLGDTWRL